MTALRSLALRSMSLLALAGAARAQTVVFADDFEGPPTAWTMTADWHVTLAASSCSSSVAPFPSGIRAARFGSIATCSFSAVTGRLRTVLPISLPAGALAAQLTFWSYESTECASGGNCGWDHRTVRVSTDGVTWTDLLLGGTDSQWNLRSADLTPFLGQSVWLSFDFEPIDFWLNDYLGWIVDDVRVEVSFAGEPSTYCTAKMNTLGCLPQMMASGDLSLGGADDLRATCVNLRNSLLAKFFWGYGANAVPFDGGTLCVLPPVRRTTPTSAGGGPPSQSNCLGTYSWDFSHAYLAQYGVVAGQTIHVQASARDLGATNSHSLSNGVAIPILP